MDLARIEYLLTAAGKAKPDASNLRSVAVALVRFGPQTGLDLPHRFCQYGCQIAHESGDFRWDREIWGPTPAQKRYDFRTDLGNTPAADGDGYLYRGRGPIQITGKYNYERFTRWAREIDPKAPDFVAQPDLVNTDPWEGLGPIWYWRVHALNALADRGDVHAITKKINGGYNGLEDRLQRYDRLALVTLGYKPTDMRLFQADNSRKFGLAVDGASGPATRAALHKSLQGLAL